MKKISSKTLVYTKTVFPLVWFGFLAVFLVLSIVDGAYKKDPIILVIPPAMAVLGFFTMKKLVWNLVDEVYDCGDSLLVKGRGVEERVPLTNIMNVSAPIGTNPPRITLRLIKPGKLGAEISFSPAAPFFRKRFAKIPFAEELIVRVDRARSQ